MAENLFVFFVALTVMGVCMGVIAGLGDLWMHIEEQRRVKRKIRERFIKINSGMSQKRGM